MQLEEVFIEKHNCKLPWMNQSLTPNDTRVDIKVCPVVDDLTNMTIKDYAKDWLIIQEETTVDSCPRFPRCHRSFYEVTESTLYNEFLASIGKSRFILRPVTSTVQYLVDSYTYDEQSFVGEVGGTLGLLMGYSFLSAVDILELACLRLLQKLGFM